MVVQSRVCKRRGCVFQHIIIHVALGDLGQTNFSGIIRTSTRFYKVPSFINLGSGPCDRPSSSNHNLPLPAYISKYELALEDVHLRLVKIISLVDPSCRTRTLHPYASRATCSKPLVAQPDQTEDCPATALPKHHLLNFIHRRLHRRLLPLESYGGSLCRRRERRRARLTGVTARGERDESQEAVRDDATRTGDTRGSLF